MLLAALVTLLCLPAPAQAGQKQFGEHIVEQAVREVAAALKNDPQYQAIPEPIHYFRKNPAWPEEAIDRCIAKAWEKRMEPGFKYWADEIGCRKKAYLHCLQWPGGKKPAQLSQAHQVEDEWLGGSKSYNSYSRRPLYGDPDCPADLSGWEREKGLWPERQRYQRRQVMARIAALTRPRLDFMQQRVDKRLDQLLDKALDRIGDGAIPASTKREIRQWFKPAMYEHGHETQGKNNKVRRLYAAAEGQTMDITDENEILRDSVGSSDHIRMFEGTISTIIARRLNRILSQPLSSSQVSDLVGSLMGQLKSIE